MPIYLDTNVLPYKGNLDSIEMSALRTLARENDHELVVPQLVVEESTAQRRRTIESLVVALTKAAKELQSYTEFSVPQQPNIDAIVDAWEADLKARFTVAVLPVGAAEDALRRETLRIPPTRDGRGARDAAIWASIKTHHQQCRRPGYFVTENVKDFADSADQTRLHPVLEAEVLEYGGKLQFCASVSALLTELAVSTQATITLDQLAASDAVREALIKCIQAPEMLFKLGDTHQLSAFGVWYIAGPVVVRPTHLRNARAFRIDNRQLTIASTEWHADFDAGVMQRAAKGGWSIQTSRVSVAFSAQLWIRQWTSGEVVEVESIRFRTASGG